MVCVNQEIPPSKDKAMLEAAKKGGKEMIEGFGKAGLMFTKRMAEGAFNAQIAQSDKEQTMEKLKAAGNEIGKALLRGAIEGANESLTGVIKGVSAFNQEMAKYDDEESDGSNPLLDPEPKDNLSDDEEEK